MAKKYKMVVFTNAVEGKDKEFNDWYQNTHLKDIVSIKSFVQAQRFRFHANLVPGGTNPARYMAIYDIETDDINAALAAMNERAIERAHAAVGVDGLSPSSVRSTRISARP